MKYLLLAACLLLTPGAWADEDPLAALRAAYLRTVPAGEPADTYADLYATILKRVERSYATEVDVPALAAAALEVLAPLPEGKGDPAEVFRKSINTALRTLDRYSRYMDAQAYTHERTQSSGSFVGVGLELESSGALVRVVAPMPGSPAERAGMQAGDLILRIDDHPLEGMPLSDSIAKMRGEAGTAVSLVVRRAGRDDDFPVVLTREPIRRQLVRWSMEGEVLVVKLRSFSGPVTDAVERAIAEATAGTTPQGIVLDMRGNGGGLLREGIGIADTFLAGGEIASSKGRTPGSRRSWSADPAEQLAGIPMVVLIDQRSASATELVAAALQSHGRAKVMGQRSYGKGTVQTTFPLGKDKGAVKLTTSFYLGPSGVAVQQAGVTPDIELVAGAAERLSPPPGAVQVKQSRCAAVYKAPDPGLACAVGYLLSGSVEAFLPALAAE